MATTCPSLSHPEIPQQPKQLDCNAPSQTLKITKFGEKAPTTNKTKTHTNAPTYKELTEGSKWLGAIYTPMYGSCVNWMWNESTNFIFKILLLSWACAVGKRDPAAIGGWCSPPPPPPPPPPLKTATHTPPFATVVRSVGHGNFKALQLTNDCTTKLGPRDHHRPSPTANAHCVRQRLPGTYNMNPSREQRPVDQAYPPPPPPPLF